MSGPGGQQPYYSQYSTPTPYGPQAQQAQRPPVNYRPAEPGWWLGADGLWWPPETAPAPTAGYGGGSQQGSGYQQPDPYGGYYSDKSKVVAGILQLAISGIGIGRFYLGYTGIGVAQLLVTIFTCGLGGIWGLIDGILILVGKVPYDGHGRLLR